MVFYILSNFSEGKVVTPEVKTQIMTFYRLHWQIPSLLWFYSGHTSRVSPRSLPWQDVAMDLLFLVKKWEQRYFCADSNIFQLKVKPVLLKLSLFPSILFWEWNLDVDLSILIPTRKSPKKHWKKRCKEPDLCYPCLFVVSNATLFIFLKTFLCCLCFSN